MTIHWQLRGMAAGLLFIALIMSGCSRCSDDPVASESCPTDESSSVVRSCKRIAFDPKKLLTGGNEPIRLELPDGIEVVAVPVETQDFEGRGFVWHGVIPGKNFSDVTIATVGTTVVGTIAFDGHMYRLRTLSDDIKVIEELNPADFPTDAPEEADPEDHPEFEPPTATCAPGTDGCEPVAAQCTHEDPTRIDVIVLYTHKALQALKSVDALHAWTYLQVFQTNRSYRQSELNHQIRLVSVIPTAYQETTNYWSRKHLIENSNPNLNAQALRDDYQADLVVLLTNAGAAAGGAGYSTTFTAANVPLPDGSHKSFEAYAFAVVDALGFETTDFTFTHELGHMMGAEHDEATESTSEGAIPGQSHGYLDETANSDCHPFMTIMAQRGEPTDDDPGRCSNCDRLAMWSSTDDRTKHCGRLVGSETAKNRDSLALTAPYISKFRCDLPSPGNVWMKDTWNDSGAEPDLTQIGADMWKSPYIWVRNQQDAGAGFSAQHLHQNAIPGQLNYVYVKLQNDGEQAEGTLEVWEADSATALLWPAHFRKAGSAGMPDFPRNSTRIVEVPWTPGGNGPYTLVAKWVSAGDPVPSPEPVNLDTLARNSNNVVWRGVNVITLDPTTDEASEILIIRNPENIGSYGRIVIRPSDANPRHSFLLTGTVIVQLDEGLLRAWERTGYQGSGFQRAGNQVQITDPAGAILQGLTLDGGAENRMRMVFRLPREGRKAGKYHLDVIQSAAGEIEARRLGGVSFEIQVTTRY